MELISDARAADVLRGFGLPQPLRVTRISGGFSDAIVWRVDAPPATFALKAYPRSRIGPGGLTTFHNLLLRGREMGITALPRVFTIYEGQTWTPYHDDAYLDIVSWHPGAPLLATDPTPSRLHAAGSILARLHQAWAPSQELPEPPISLHRRWHSLQSWPALRNTAPTSDQMAEIKRALERVVGTAEKSLMPWLGRVFSVQPILGDVWYAHILFVGDEVTGLIDHASVRVDHPVVDLARLLSSLELTPIQRSTLLESYQQVRKLSLEELELLLVLESTGILGALIHWYDTLTTGTPETPAIRDRIQFLLRRAESLNPNG
ncbi:MAG: phosphotransferase enzyme family protein [Gemmataceae bacterium]